MLEKKSPMLIKALDKYETLVLESNKGRIEIVVSDRVGSQTIVHVYAPKSIKISSTMDRKDQYKELDKDKTALQRAKEMDTVKYFASGKGKVD